MEILVGAVSDIGNVKAVNEDNILIKIKKTDRGQMGIFAICDGMGGLSKGEIASSKVISGVEEWFKYDLEQILKNDNYEELILNSLVDTINAMNSEIVRYSSKIGEKLGTTASILLLLFDKYYIVHVGDSRVYKLRKKVEQLTEDHTYVAMSVKNKIMTKEEAKVNPRRNVLTQCVGVLEQITPFAMKGILNGDERFILCSDGLYNKLDEEESFKEIAKEKFFDNNFLQKAAAKLVDKVKKKGERDNISVIIVGIYKTNEGLKYKLQKLFKH